MIRVGTSGYSYEDWKGTVYPAKIASRDMLEYYARSFDVVEVNYTYYSMPNPATLASMARKACSPVEHW